MRTSSTRSWKEIRAFLRNPPGLRVGGVRSDQDDAFGFRERQPRIDERLAVASRAVQQEQQRRVSRGGLLGNEKIVGPGDATGTEGELLDLGLRRW